LLSQVDVYRLEAKLADGTITSRLEAAIACRPAGTTLRPPARQPEVRMSMCPVLGTLVPFGIHRTCRIVADWLRAQRSCLENPNMVTHGLRLARGASWTGAKHSAPSNGVEAAASAEPSPDWVWCGQARGSSRAAASRRPPSPTEAARGRAALRHYANRNGNLEAVGITTCHVVDRWPRRPDSAYEFCLVAMAWNARRETQKARA
jgi:hypothetical protein